MVPNDPGTTLYKKVYGYLLGAAIGDAFGFRTELMHYRDIEDQYGRVTHFDALPPRQAEPAAASRAVQRVHPRHR